MENVASRRVSQCVKHAVHLLVCQSIYNHLVIGYASYDPTPEGAAVSATVLYMSMSLDGFVAGPNEGPDNGLGDGGHRLHEWAFTGADADHKGVGRPAGVNGQIFDEFMSTGAVVAGRGTFEPAGGWGGDHHDGVPIFILTRHDPADLRQWPLVTYVNDVTTAMTRAREAAGAKDVLVHGAGTAQLALAAGVLDELELHVIPVLFGQGRRLFEGLAAEQIELERTRVLEGEGGVTHMHYQVKHGS
jgi:dihydrofolate reductase